MSADDENIYDTIEIEDLDFQKSNKTFYYPCPCGDKFAITLKQIYEGYDIAECPSCSLQIKIVLDMKYIIQTYGGLIIAA